VIARSGQADIAFDVTGGDDQSPPVLLLHAGVNDRRGWAPLRAVLTRRSVAFDRRGYGETRYVAEAHSHVDDALAVLDAAGFANQPVAVVGASMGGRVALDLALAHPERVDALVLIGPAVRGAPQIADDELNAAEAELSAAIDAADEAGDLDTLNRLEAWAWLDGWNAGEGRVAGPARDLFLEMNAIALAAPEVGEETELASAWDQAGDVRVPALMLLGEFDLQAGNARGVAVAERMPDARVERLAETAHLPHAEGHPACLARITDFLG
jgi:pimeloyl-ACP methyl ester carboxylesterase